MTDKAAIPVWGDDDSCTINFGTREGAPRSLTNVQVERLLVLAHLPHSSLGNTPLPPTVTQLVFSKGGDFQREIANFLGELNTALRQQIKPAPVPEKPVNPPVEETPVQATGAPQRKAIVRKPTIVSKPAAETILTPPPAPTETTLTFGNHASPTTAFEAVKKVFYDGKSPVPSEPINKARDALIKHFIKTRNQDIPSDTVLTGLKKDLLDAWIILPMGLKTLTTNNEALRNFDLFAIKKAVARAIPQIGLAVGS